MRDQNKRVFRAKTAGRELLGPPSPDALLLEDRGFFSYAHWKKLDARGTKLLIRLKAT